MIAAPSDPRRTQHKTNSLHGDLKQQRTVPNLLEIRSLSPDKRQNRPCWYCDEPFRFAGLTRHRSKIHDIMRSMESVNGRAASWRVSIFAWVLRCRCHRHMRVWRSNWAFLSNWQTFRRRDNG
jgi:hypothetical protein